MSMNVQDQVKQWFCDFYLAFLGDIQITIPVLIQIGLLMIPYLN